MAGEFVEVIGGPLDGSRMELTEETRHGFSHKSSGRTYVYELKQTCPNKGDFIVRRRFFLKEVTSGKRKGKREEGGT